MSRDNQLIQDLQLISSLGCLQSSFWTFLEYKWNWSLYSGEPAATGVHPPVSMDAQIQYKHKLASSHPQGAEEHVCGSGLFTQGRSNVVAEMRCLLNPKFWDYVMDQLVIPDLILIMAFLCCNSYWRHHVCFKYLSLQSGDWVGKEDKGQRRNNLFCFAFCQNIMKIILVLCF